MIPTILMNKNLIFAIIITIAIVAGYMYLETLKDRISALEKSLAEKEQVIAYAKLEKERLETAISKQNEDIELLQLNEQLALNKLAKWKAQKPEVRYKVIEKIREVHSNDCEDIKNQLDAIRSIDHNDL